MAAITAVFHRLAPGDHVVLPGRVYSGLRTWLGSAAVPEFRPNTIGLRLYQSSNIEA
jgi:cystathionine beta-lyase/cystathionine gamma-synthase